jgi:O-antigen/teichoic acid export membrane protein
MPTQEKAIRPAHASLGASARASLIWGGGFTLARDFAQFAAMLILVRWLTPNDYGVVAVAQAIYGLVSVASFSVLSAHALQARDPGKIDWQSHFTAAVIVNLLLCLLIMLFGWGLTFTERYAAVAVPLGALGLALIVDILSVHRQRMLEVEHDWKRWRILLLVGGVLGLAAGVIIAFMGGGVWALVVQVHIQALPASIDFFYGGRFRPAWSFDLSYYREVFRFALNRLAATGLWRTRLLIESVTLASVLDLASLGVFNRATGLGALLAGRIASLTMMTLYPIITRNEPGSAEFRRFAELALTGAVWCSIASALILIVSPDDIVNLIYGNQWTDVGRLLPLAVLAVTAGGFAVAGSMLVLASNELKLALWLDLISAALGICAALVLIRFGAVAYLAGLIVHGVAATAMAMVILLVRKGVSARGLVTAFVPPLVAGAAAVSVVLALRYAFGVSPYAPVRLILDCVALGTVYIATFRFLFAAPLLDLLMVLPAGKVVARALLMDTHKFKQG